MEFTNSTRSNTLYNLDLEEEEAPLQTHNPSNPPSPSSSPIFVEKEHMFDKVVTPSDVGKLNRLVIPKQHAEKYFPLDTSSNEKGLLLSFEDRAGKPWRFRYSYWNSSQSYVMTKGWSRFVKEKRLTAGDTVSFCRGVGETGRGRLFIDWRRRPEQPLQQFQDSLYHQRPPIPLIPWGNSTSARVLVPPYDYSSTTRYQYYHQHHHQQQQQVLYYRPQIMMQQQSGVPMVLDSVPVETPGASKRLRLFGVNLDCPAESGESSRGESGILSRVINTHQYLGLAPPGETEASDLSEKEDCSLDLDL